MIIKEQEMIDGLSRRSLILASGAGAAVATSPAFSASSASGGKAAAPRAEWVYDAVVQLQQTVAHGQTIRGQRFRAPIIGGEFAGDTLRGRIIPGGYDWQLVRSDGYWELSADYFMETSDGAQIHVLNRGLWFSPTGDWPASYAITTPRFEAPDGPYAWMNRHIFTGTVGQAGTDEKPAVRIAVFRLLPA